MASGSDDLGMLVDRVPDGWTPVTYRDRTYGLRRTSRAAGRSVAIYAEELGGVDVVSTNVYRTGAGDVLRPCEMSAATVLAFLQGWQPATPATSVSPAGASRARPARRG